MAKFWNVVKEVTTQAIREEAKRSFLLGLTGEAAAIAAVRQAFLGPDPSPEQIDVARPFLLEVPQPVTAEDLRELSRCQLVLLADGSVAPADVRPAETLWVSDPEQAITQLLEHRPAWALSLARHFPGFRPEVCRQIILKQPLVSRAVDLLGAQIVHMDDGFGVAPSEEQGQGAGEVAEGEENPSDV